MLHSSWVHQHGLFLKRGHILLLYCIAISVTQLVNHHQLAHHIIHKAKCDKLSHGNCPDQNSLPKKHVTTVHIKSVTAHNQQIVKDIIKI
jgi:hypothetical protein